MPFLRQNFPEVEAKHVAHAKLFANRHDMVRSIAPKYGYVAEVGVGTGHFSSFLIDTLKPRKFFALDMFLLHRMDSVWGIETSVLFEGMTHLEYYKQRMKRCCPDLEMSIEEGMSRELLAKYPDVSLDLIYIDASHDYNDVKGDASEAIRILKPEGMIIFNDYTLMDPLRDIEYGIVQTVNELLAAGGWQVVGFALEKHMFCDIALTRA